MDTDLPKFNIIYSEIIKGITFDFEVEFTLFGEILSISNDFLLESEEAQEARFYDKTSEIVKHLKLAKTLLKYFIPLALMGYLEKKGWNKFKEKFDETIAQEPTLGNLDPSEAIKDDWVRAAWEWHETKNITLKFLCGLYFSDKGLSTSERNALLKNRSPFIDTFLFDLIPILEIKGTAGWSYLFFSSSVSLEKLDFLLRRWTNTFYEKYHFSILQRLSEYDHPKIKKNLIQYYYQNQSFNKDSMFLSHFCHALRKYFDKEVEEILFELLQNKGAAAIACRILIKMGCTEEQIANHLEPIFDSSTSLELKKTLLSAYQPLSSNWRPSEEKILDVIVELWKENEAMYQPPRILLSSKSDTTKKRLVELLSHENIKIRKGVIRLYRSSKSKEDIKTLINTLNSNNKEIFEDILSVLSDHFKRHLDKQWVIPFLNTRNCFTLYKDRNQFYRILRGLIEKTEFDDVSIIPTLMAEIYVKGKPRENDYDKTTAQKEIIQILSSYAERDKSIFDFFLQIASDYTIKDEIGGCAIRTLGYLDYPNFFERFKDELKNGSHYKKQGALDGLKSHVDHNPFLRQLLIDQFSQNDYSYTTPIISKLFPHPDNISLLEKCFMKLSSNDGKSVALRNLFKIPEFIGSPTFYRVLQKNGQEMMREVQRWYNDIVLIEDINNRLTELTWDNETSAIDKLTRNIREMKKNKLEKYLKEKVEKTKYFKKQYLIFEKLAEKNEQMSDIIKVVKLNASKRRGKGRRKR